MKSELNRLMVWAITLDTALAALRDRDRPCDTGVDIRDSIQSVIDELKAAAQGEGASVDAMLEWACENVCEFRKVRGKVRVIWIDEGLQTRSKYGTDWREAIGKAMREQAREAEAAT